MANGDKPKSGRNANKIIQLILSTDLYEQFVNSRLRRESNTDSEAIRCAIKQAIESE